MSFKKLWGKKARYADSCYAVSPITNITNFVITEKPAVEFI